MTHTRLKRLYLFVFVLHLGLLWWIPFFPSQDGPSHVYNTLILHDLLSGGATYGGSFDLNLLFVPNLGATASLYVLTAFLPPLIAEKVFLSIFMALLVGVVPKLARLAGNEPFPVSFVVFPLLFSHLSLPGFYSLMLGVPLWLWAMWLLWRMRPCALWQRWLAITACSTVLFACHLLPFACYVLAIGCSVLVERRVHQAFSARLREAAALLTLPLLLLGGYGWTLLRGAQQGQAGVNGQSGPVGLLTGLNFRQDLSAVLGMLTFEQVTLSPYQVFTGLWLGLFLIRLLCRRETRQAWRATDEGSYPGKESLMARRWLLLVGLGLFAAMILVPDRVGELSLVKLRFGPLIPLVLAPLVSFAVLPTSLGPLFLLSTLTAALMNSVLLLGAAHQVQAFVTALPARAVHGHFVAGYRGSPAPDPIDPLRHATSYFCAQHGCVDVGNYQAQQTTAQFFVRFKTNSWLPAFRLQLEAAPTTIAWEQYPEVAYLLGWDFGSDERMRIGNLFTLLNEEGAVSLWRRKTDERARP